MSDETALLNAIAAHPDEDTPRLMYADWLEEHGQRIRAEFIRVQIEIARVEELPRIELNQYVGLFQRNQELIDNHRAELLGPLAKLPADADVQFHRGFVSEVTLSVFHFHQLRDAISTIRPVPHVTVRDSVGVVREFLGFNVFLSDSDGSPLVTAVSTLPDNSGDETWEPFPTLMTPLKWPRLETLDVSGCRLGDSNAATLLQESSFPALADLDVSGNVLTDAAVDSLLNSGLSPRLKRLILGGNDITDVGAMALASRWPTGTDDRLEKLNLRFTHISQAGQSALLRRFGGRIDLF